MFPSKPFDPKAKMFPPKPFDNVSPDWADAQNIYLNTDGVSVQYNGGLLPDIMLLTRGYYHRGTRLNAMKR